MNDAMHTMALRRREVLRAAAAGSAALALPGFASAQDKFPSRPITLICPWPAGGPSDAVIRAFAEAAAKNLGGTIVVENKPGVGGALGASALMTAKPDGYTLSQLPLGIYRMPHMQKMTFDPLALTHIICVTGYTFGITATPDAPYKTLKEMVAWAKANPGKLAYGHTGTGTTPHLAFEEFAHKAGFTTAPVPYKGAAELMQAALGGHLQLVSSTTEFAPLVKSGKLRLLATLGRERNKSFPDVPTVKESGWDTVTESPFGFGGPKGMPPDVVAKLHDAFRAAIKDPKVDAMLDQFFQPVIYMNTADYTAYAKRTFEAERATIERMGLTGKGLS